MKKSILTLAVLIAVVPTLKAIELPAQLGDHAVLQQQSEAKLWGWANPGATVTAQPSWCKKAYKTQADDKGRWTIYVATPEASYTPYSITFTEGKESKTISDILIGEVWLCSGQSNMEMPMQGFNAEPVEGAAADIARSGALRDKVRQAYIVRGDLYEPQERIDGAWMEASPSNTALFGAIGFYFARELNSLIDVPIGILNVTYGGTMIEGWLPEDILLKYDYDLETAKNEKDRLPAHYHTTKYNSMLVPLIGYTIKGFLWNQGESNLHNPQMYSTLVSELVARWRKDWGDAENSLPFYQTEIPPFSYFDSPGIISALMREQQNMAAKTIPNSGIVCTNDLVRPDEENDIHGSMKREIGERLAWQVAERQYGIDGMPWRSPEFLKMEKCNNGMVRLSFTNCERGLVPNDDADITGFEVAGADGVFYPAKAANDWAAHQIVLQCDQVPEIVNVRYCFHNWSPGPVKNLLGMPLVPFRTDK